MGYNQPKIYNYFSQEKDSRVTEFANLQQRSNIILASLFYEKKLCFYHLHPFYLCLFFFLTVFL